MRLGEAGLRRGIAASEDDGMEASSERAAKTKQHLLPSQQTVLHRTGAAIQPRSVMLPRCGKLSTARPPGFPVRFAARSTISRCTSERSFKGG